MNEKELLQEIIGNFNLDKWDTFFSKKNRKFKKETDFPELDNYGFLSFINGRKHGIIPIEDDELVIASFKVTKNLTERSGKKDQYDLAKKILKEDLSLSGGIFIFYDENGNFRFSLITKIYEKTSRGIKENFTSFKRYTYFVSKYQTNKTFIDQISSADFSSLEKIISAFSVKKVTEEFYKELSTWYHYSLSQVNFPSDLEEMKDENKRNAVNLIRLITRIIFIWFLKEKHLIPNEIFDKDYVAKIVKDFNKNKESHYYYNAILQNLFFGTLNRQMNDRKFARKGDYYENRNEFDVKNLYRNSDFLLTSEEEFISLFQKVPFLNGGLFECLDKGNIYVDGFSRKNGKMAIVPDYLFFSDEKEVDLKEYGFKQKEIFKGLINILQEYNFTIDENSPVDEEIALDPELLGMVFENLLASYNPETQETARKSSGSYYTPREIVNYMVDESLIAYFKENIKELDEEIIRDIVKYNEKEVTLDEGIKEKIVRCISNLKVIDPACGSGAFPMGMLHKLVYILQKVDVDNKVWQDIQIENAILESEKVFIDTKDKSEREGILKQINEAFDESINHPDYARKLFIIENCIYGVDIQPIAIQISKLRFFISLVIDQKVDDKKENRGILSLPNLETKFVAANSLIPLNKPGLKVAGSIFERLSGNYDRITEIKERLAHLRHRHFSVKTRNEKKKLRDEYSSLRKQLEELLKSSDYDHEVAHKIAQFDIFDQNKVADWFDPEWMFGVSDGFDIVIGNPPYIQLQNNKGALANLYQDKGYESFKRSGDIYILFYERGVMLLKDGGFLCFITSNKWMRAGYGEAIRKFFTKYDPLLLIDLGPNIFESATVDTNILLIRKAKPSFSLKAVTLQKKNGNIDIEAQLLSSGVILTKLTKDAWFIGSNAEQQLKEKIERIGKPLKDWDVNIYYGIKTGLNEAFIITTEKRNEILSHCKDDAERQRTEAIIKPILRGRDIKRYYYEWAGLWVIGTFPALRLNIDDYPALKKYFLDHFDIRQLEQSGKKYPELGFNARKKTGNKWFETQDQIAYYTEFEKEKIFFKAVGRNLTFAKVEPGTMITAPASFLTGKHLNYILGFLCSQFTNYYVEQTSDKTGAGDIMLNVQSFERIKLPPITSSNETFVRQIETLVDKIISAKREDPQSDTQELEREIDKIVYKLYYLTEEEIKIIESKE
ncbi:BREX-1 system adenine-specific DNA-methyltransferase PglX [Deferribacterales bacterium Es71-Z0220]|uniref:Eco57I restriction-modification methylase domain-containing protein n=1 Tax=Deferrivibrio essentukiensis TaxID=2880922 RepID=UPI001F61601D|nr:N-6 DNA methylase [Deferrivibrio essentukiensis]MCB4205522.1 BREX-1 system adenine-specific DNA-methyltransferase PglX [Deferrivibrio essentukiensis]